MLLHVPEFAQPLVLAVPVAVVFYLISLRCFSIALRYDCMYVRGFNQPLVLAITAVVISFSITAVFHIASVIRTCCLLRSSCSSSQIYFQLALGLRVYFENLFLTVGLSYLRFVFHTMI